MGAFLLECERSLLKSLCYQAVFPSGIVLRNYNFTVFGYSLSQIYRSYAARLLLRVFVCYKYIAATQRKTLCSSFSRIFLEYFGSVFSPRNRSQIYWQVRRTLPGQNSSSSPRKRWQPAT